MGGNPPGAAGTSVSLLTVALFAVWGTIHGQGPFVTASAEESALSTQLFLIVLSIPLLLLSSVLEQNRKTAKALQQSEEQLRLAIGAAKIGTWDWSIHEAQRPGRTKRNACLDSPAHTVRPCLNTLASCCILTIAMLWSKLNLRSRADCPLRLSFAWHFPTTRALGIGERRGLIRRHWKAGSNAGR